VVPFTSSSVSTSLTRWEWTEYIAEAFVVLGCLGELVAEVGEKWLGERRSRRLERWSTVVLILALMVSLKALVRTNELSGFVIGSLGDKADRADAKAQTALTDSATASGEAAQSKSTAEGAKTEADSADKELDTVQSQVAAVSKKAQTLDWTMAQVQFLSSRYLLDPAGLKTELSAFRGMPIIFRSYLNEGDGYFLCKSIVSVAKEAGILPTDQCGMGLASVPFVSGISVAGPNDDTMLALSKALGRQTPFGSSAGPFGNAPHSPNWIVFVGMKNLSFVGETAQTRDAARSAQTSKPKARP
jgi:hypothetical protein